MASTNKTQHYNLPQWESNDKPTFLGDFNTSFATIDTALYNNNVTGDTALNLANDLKTTSIRHNTEISDLQTGVNNLEQTSALHTTHLNEIDRRLNNLKAVLLYKDPTLYTQEQMIQGVKITSDIPRTYHTYIFTDNGHTIMEIMLYNGSDVYKIAYGLLLGSMVTSDTNLTDIFLPNLFFGDSIMKYEKLRIRRDTGAVTITGAATNGIEIWGCDSID